MAFIGNYNASNPLDREVENTAGVGYEDFDTSGIGDITLGDTDEAEVYTLSGVKMESDSLEPGIYVIREGGKARKIVVR